MADDDLAEAFLMQDERELHYPGMLLPFQIIDETSNDSMCSIKSRGPMKRESVGDYLQMAASLDKFFRQADELDPMAGRSDEPANVSISKASKDRTPEKQTVPTRSRVSSEDLLKTKKDKQKKKRDKSLTSDLLMDQVVQSQVDGVLLDCLEEELPTVPFDGVVPGSELLSLLDTYQSCMSMNVCNSRWLRPSRPAVLGNQLGEDSCGSSSSSMSSSSGGNAGRQLTSAKKSSLPFKPKRLVIYKEDLPGFKFDNDIELEKLPVSKRCLAKSGGVKEEPVAAELPVPIPAKKADKTVESEKTVEAPAASPKSGKKKGIKREVFISRKEKAAGDVEVVAIKTEPPVEKDDDTASVSSNTSSSSR